MSDVGGFRYLPGGMAERLRGVEVQVERAMDGSHQGLHKSRAFGSSVEFAEYREYVAGDPIARIDWPVYARSDRYVIRQYHEDVSIRCCVLLDTSESMAYEQDGPMSKMEYGCYLAAGMMYMMVQQGDTVSLVTFAEGLGDGYEPASSFAGLKPMLEGLETVAARGVGDVERSLHEAAEQMGGKGLVVVISDFLQDTERIRRGLHHLYHDGMEVTLLHVLDPAELRLPTAGLVEVRALETGEGLTVDLREVQAGYQEQVRRYEEELRGACASVRGRYVRAETRMEVLDVLMARGRRR